MDIKLLQKENETLKRKLQVAQAWMEREVKNQVAKIARRKVWKFTSDMKHKFFHENVEEIISTKISEYFWEIMLLNVPSGVIENIISAEVSYFNLRENPQADGFWVISSYHKSLDALIENYITKWFRKFAHKQNQTILRKNDILEKSLNSVVNKWYILSVWRLYHLLKLIKEEQVLYDYGQCFYDYLKKYNYLWDMLLSDDFFQIFTKLVESEILGKKRHVGKISFLETRDARKLLIWDFSDFKSLIYKLLETQNLEY